MTLAAARPHRLAVYFAPDPAHPLWRAGCDWLGRDPLTPDPGTPPPHARDPWRYGFHATLKSPLVLRAGTTGADFLRAVETVARAHAAFAMPPLEVGMLDGFIALLPTRASAELQALADACVRELDGFRAAPSAAEVARRLRLPLDAEQRALLDLWGYPHVLARWRFHMTLTDRIDPADTARRDELLAVARAHFAPALAAPLPCAALAVFTEPRAGEPFMLARRLPLG